MELPSPSPCGSRATQTPTSHRGGYTRVKEVEMSGVLTTLRRSDTLRPLTCMHSQAHCRVVAHLQLCDRAKTTQHLLCHTAAPHTARPHSSEGDPFIKRQSMQLSMSAGPFVPPSAYAEHIGSVAAPCHQLCCTRAASALVGAALRVACSRTTAAFAIALGRVRCTAGSASALRRPIRPPVTR